jgi:hypothetical protein
VALDNVVHDGQSQAAVTLFAAGFIESLKRLQRTVPLIRGYSFALIPDLDLEILLFLS